MVLESAAQGWGKLMKIQTQELGGDNANVIKLANGF